MEENLINGRRVSHYDRDCSSLYPGALAERLMLTTLTLIRLTRCFQCLSFSFIHVMRV